jgi:riboflavin transporter FmnP
MAAVLMLFEIPLFFAPGFYKIDLSEIPVLICTFALGPVAGVVSEFVKIILELAIRGTTTAFVGEFANFAIGCSFVLPASILYHKIKTKKGAWIGMASGTLFMTVFGSLFNAVYLLPTFAKMFGSLDAIIEMGTLVNANITSVSTLVFYAVVPFNLLKGVVVSVLTFILYKRTERLLHIK